jgi:hypothetical protein
MQNAKCKGKIIMAALKLVEEDLRFKFYTDDTFFLAYNKGCLTYGDFYRSKPDFYPVFSPSGREVTCSMAYRYNHHHSIWIGHAKVNGINFFHDNNPTRENLGDIVLEQATSRVTEDRFELRTINGWVSKKGERVLTEHRDITVTPGQEAHLIDIVSTVIATEGPIRFEQDNHTYLGVRVADSMDEEDGGRILNSEGQVGEQGTMRQYARWIDYSGIVAGKRVGITIMNHPSNPKTAFFTRSYGTVLSSFTLFEGKDVAEGERLVQGFRLVIHEGGPEEVDLEGAYDNFIHKTL